jgi:DNA modification methylase/ParB-like chromosome segregation protein Spo0J
MRISLDLIDITNPSAEIDQSALKELADSINEKGLSHAVIVRPANDSGRYPLASGEKRVLACKILGHKDIEAVIKNLTEKEGKEIRLHENLKRFNLPWYDQVVLVEELHKLRQEEHGVAKVGRPSIEDSDGPKQGWSIRDTAKELNVGIGALSEDLSLARALRDDPTLRKVKDKKTAVRLARVIAQRRTSEQEAGLPTTFDANQVYLGDSASILSALPAASIDHCVTDPPWIKFFDPALRIDERTVPVFREVYRVLKHGAFLYVFCGLDDYAYYAGVDKPNPDNPTETIHDRGILETIGFAVSNTPVIWRKGNALSRRGVRQWEYDRDFEFIIVAVKGNPALTTSRRLSGIKEADIVHPAHMIHPNEKPASLIEDIVTDCSYEGNIILDPFGGSGILGEVCKATKRKYIICERDKKFYDGICNRLKTK